MTLVQPVRVTPPAHLHPPLGDQEGGECSFGSPSPPGPRSKLGP